jgi:hypothetical protein
MVHRGQRSEYAVERTLVRANAHYDRERGEVAAQNTEGMKFFTEGEILIDPRGNGSLQRDLPVLS